MKLYKVFFFVKGESGKNISHYPHVAIRKVPSKNAYIVKWDFSDSLVDSSNKSKTVSAANEKEAIKAFICEKLFWGGVEFIDFDKVEL